MQWPGRLTEATMRTAALVQGAFFAVTGLWPIAHYRSFERVTGPKVDDWLVKTTGGVLAAVGATLLASALRRPTRRPRRSNLRTLGMSTTAALALADLVYVARGRIPRVYLIDAAAEAVLFALWLRERRPPR
jgi:hypothetical protein